MWTALQLGPSVRTAKRSSIAATPVIRQSDGNAREWSPSDDAGSVATNPNIRHTIRPKAAKISTARTLTIVLRTPADMAQDKPDIPENRAVTIPATAAASRLDRVLADELADISRSRVKALIESGMVTLAGRTISEPSYRVKPGQAFAVCLPLPVPAKPLGQRMPLAIVYEDEQVIVIDKPPGLVVHPAPGNPDRTLVNALIAHCGDELAGIGGVRRPGIVHRLDKDTSGLMVAAKTARAHERLTAQFAARSIGRTYNALVWGVPNPRAGRIEGNIGRNPRNRKKMAVLERGGKAAATDYRLLRALGPADQGLPSLVECRLATGRTHQIRVHMTHLGHALVGDPLYGRKRHLPAGPDLAAARVAVERFQRQALHATTLAFDHPVTAVRIEFTSNLPNDMRSIIQSLE